MADELTQVAEDSARGGFFLFSGTAASTIIMAIASILIGRFLGPELYGQYTLILIVPQMLVIFTDLGISQGITKFTAELQSKAETEKIANIIKYGMILRSITGIGIFLINYIFSELFATILLQRPDLTSYVQLASSSILFQVIFTTATSAFVGIDKTEYAAYTTNIQALAKTVISITLVLLGFSVAGAISGFITSYIISAIAAICLLAVILRNKSRRSNNSNFNETAKTLLGYGAPLYLSTLIAGFIPILKNLILAFFTTDSDIGNYKAAINFATLLTVLAIPITTALLPAFSKLTDSTHRKITNFFKLANKYTTILVIPASLLMIILSNDIVQIIYGTTYRSASSYLAINCILYFLVGLGYLVLPSFYNGIGKTRITLKMSLITFIILLALAPLLTKVFSVAGLIISFLIGSTASNIYGLLYVRREFKIKFDSGALLRIYLISFVSSILPILIINFANLSSILNVVVGGFVYVFIYVSLIPIMKAITLTELKTAKGITEKIRFLSPIAKVVFTYQERILRKRPFGSKSSTGI